RRLPLPDRLTVYPRYDGWRPEIAAIERAVAEAAGRRAGEGYELYGTREYRRGDALRHVDWRGTARRGQVIVREREHLARASVEVVLDTRFEWGEGRDTTVEHAIRIAAATADLARRLGHPFRLRAAGSPPEGWWPLLDHLAGLRAGEGPGLAALVEECSPRAILVVPIAMADVATIDRLAGLQRRGA